ncbi:MAG: carboxypeptidase-like regulatory domain-containing protein [Polyangia bacterium]
MRRAPLVNRSGARLVRGLLLAASLCGLPLFPSLRAPLVGPQGVARAQPMMPDPAQMSGIPRQDPAVPAGTVTVRLIRGEMSSRLPDVEVQLVDLDPSAKDKPPRLAKTDAEGRATFAEVPPSTYQARSSFDGEPLTSQPIQVQAAPAPGMRVLLVFQKSVEEQQKELGTPDGKARVDLSLPPGVLVIRALDENRQPVPDLPVGLVRAEAATEKVEQLPQKKTGTDGSARYEGLSGGTEFAYMAMVMRDGNEVRSMPFRLAKDHGSQLALRAQPTARGQQAVEQLQIGLGSHIIFEPQDDSVSVLELLRLQNPLSTAVDPGPQGVRIPLAEGALSAQLPQGSPPNLSIDSAKDGPPDVVWKGPVPPGETMIQVGYLIRHHGEVRFRQAAGLPLAGLRVVVEQLANIQIDGTTAIDHQTWQGKNLMFGSVAPVARGGTLSFTISGLPAEQMYIRWLAAILALGIAAAFTLLSVYGKPATRTIAEQRRSLHEQRDALLAELLKLDERAGKPEEAPDKGGKKADGKRSREVVLAELEQIYRALDELESSGVAPGAARNAG